VRVLSARQFEHFLERERSLADRGTRRFSLLVLRRRAEDSKALQGPGAIAKLAQQVCDRLRSTDLVGRPDADRVEVILTDTEPAGAQVVALWVKQLETVLGLDLELTIYVYPSVIDRSLDQGPDVDEGENGHSIGPGNGRTSRERTVATVPHLALVAKASMTTSRISGRGTEAVPGGRWPMEDLWPLLGVPSPWWKRSLDVVFSVLALLALAPLFGLIAIAIRFDSPGPVIFSHKRAGRGGRPFDFYKFRSMIADAEERRAELVSRNEKDGPIFKIREDPRITRVGRLLRRWSLDELPQLWNVLKGDISLVGPRSPTVDEVSKYERWHRRRLDVTGGITCTWQVSGRSEISFRDWMRLDMRYVTCRNLWLDLRLLLKTLPAVISGRGAC
jgi:lipopolysaccharide/colanic/teichoic acid biosynthesis glycosyltransferase